MSIEKKLADKESCIVNTVHDSIVIDVHPDELDWVIHVVQSTNDNIKDIIREWLEVDFNVPLLLEAKIGNNWLDMKDVA